MNRYKFFVGLLLCLVVMGCSSIHDDEEDVIEHIVVGDHVPSFSVSVVDDGSPATFSTSHLTGETVIVFFSTLCGDCKRELPELNDYYLRHKDDPGFQMVAISRGEERIWWLLSGKSMTCKFLIQHSLTGKSTISLPRQLFPVSISCQRRVS